MDLRLIMRVLWRFRLLVLGGFCVATLLAVLSVVRIDPGGSPTFSYRGTETWIASSRLFVTEPGFPWGRRLINPIGDDGSAPSTQSDPNRFTGLAVLYSNFADSDPVRRLLQKDGPFKSKIAASPVPADSDGNPLPIIEVSATGTSPLGAILNTRRASNALVAFIEGEQRANGIAVRDRVILEQIDSPRKPVLVAGRPKVVPVFIFVFIMGLTIGLALLLENLRPAAAPADIRVEDAAATPESAATRLRMPA
jgi:hypothetical protein